MIGTPVIILHKDVTGDNADDLRVGINSEAYYNISDGWYYADGVMWNKTAQNLVTDQDWSVSCSYDILEVDDTGGVENNIEYDAEFTKLNFKHLALVNNPRYERANIVFNSKTFNIENFSKEQPRVPKGQPNGGQWVKDDALIQQKKDNLIPIEVNEDDIPQFETKEDLGNWFKGIFEDLGNVTISDTGIRIDLYGGNANREAFKRRFQQEPNKAVAKAFEEVVTKSIKVDERQKDERHKHNQDIYYNKLKLGKDNYDVNLFIDYLEPNKEYRYAGHSMTKIDNKMSTRDTQVINHIMLTKVDNPIINDLIVNFNPNVKEHEAQASRVQSVGVGLREQGEQETEARLMRAQQEINNDKEQEMALLDELKKLINKVENTKGEKDMEIDNEKVDKRDIIRQIMAIAGKEEASEDVRTIAKLAEKLAYDKSEAGTANNEVSDTKKGKKDDEENPKNSKEVKNEDEKDEKEVKEIKKEVKEDVENKCKNSVDNSKPDYFGRLNEIYNAATSNIEQKTEYVSRADREKAAEDYFAR